MYLPLPEGVQHLNPHPLLKMTTASLLVAALACPLPSVLLTTCLFTFYSGLQVLTECIPCKQNLKLNLYHSCVMARLLKVFWTFSCVIFPGIPCSETRKIHVIIPLSVEFLVICASKTLDVHITIEHVTRNVHYS